MPGFADAMQYANQTRLPVVEGITLRLREDVLRDEKLHKRLASFLSTRLGGTWNLWPTPGSDWLDLYHTTRRSPLPLDQVWDVVRGLQWMDGVIAVEPLMLVRVPLATDHLATPRFGVWGPSYDTETLRQIEERSVSVYWSLDALHITDTSDPQTGAIRPGAWTVWRNKIGKDVLGKDVLPGTGVRIAHPDTGYTANPHLLPALNRYAGNKEIFGFNYVERLPTGAPTEDAYDMLGKQDENDANAEGEDETDAYDELEIHQMISNPGHGTHTGTLIVGPINESIDSGEIQGVAPGASLLPLRVSNSVAHVSFLNVAQAIDKAIEEKVDIIALSLGGPVPSHRLEASIQKAVDAGIIVIAAAGNLLPTVVFPAKLPGVIAVAASNPLDSPWNLSGFGEEVAILAPGEKVWHTTFTPPKRRNSTKSGKQTGETNSTPQGTSAPHPMTRGDGTSFATANVAGLAALWLSYHRKEEKDGGKEGKDELIQKYGQELIPYAFRLALQKSATSVAGRNSGGFGTGLPQADQLLSDEVLPSREEAEQERERARQRRPAPGQVILSRWGSLGQLLRVPTRSQQGETSRPLAEGGSAPETSAQETVQKMRAIVATLLGVALDAPQPPTPEGGDAIQPIDALFTGDPALMHELAYLLGTHPPLHHTLLNVGQRWQPKATVSLISLRNILLSLPISHALRQRLNAAQTADKAASQKSGYILTTEKVIQAYETPMPPTRRLRVYAFDPSLATQMKTVSVNRVTVEIPFEKDLARGPVGEYLEVVDVDPATGCAYYPVDLNHPYLLAQNGLAPTEGNPQFHQQMVYAVAMKTISQFETALGRPIFWAPLRPHSPDSFDAKYSELRFKNGLPDKGDQYLPCLRLYPHALREENAYYSPQKRAILFGYFPGHDVDPGNAYPGGMVFTCLSHDIIAHEMTHAILDGMHPYFTEPTNPDVFAFHEAFADIIALFAHFSYPEVLQHQLAETDGRLDIDNLLVNLAQQFGVATGRHQALRSAIGTAKDSDGKGSDGKGSDGKSTDGKQWQRYIPDPDALSSVLEAHQRGAILVAAVFDAYLAIYNNEVEDLRRIATGGTGVLPQGRLHPDLVNRMATTAAKTAKHVLSMCIRAMDYVPPVDITFGEFLRALITADYDLVPDDPRRYRIAFIEAFRKWGIYPRDVRTLSEDSLRWHRLQETPLFYPTSDSQTNAQARKRHSAFEQNSEEIGIRGYIREAVHSWQMGKPRAQIFASIHKAQAALHAYLTNAIKWDQLHGDQSYGETLLPGINPDWGFEVTNMRPARRIGPRNEFLTEMVVEIVQTKKESTFRGGVTLIIGLDDWQVRYSVYKATYNSHSPTDATERERREATFRRQAFGVSSKVAEYSCEKSDAPLQGDRTVDMEAMRLDSCQCRQCRKGNPALSQEPFAMLHQTE